MSISSLQRGYPPFYKRIYSVWFRHMRVYGEHIFSNGFPPFVEPLIFLAGVGLGLGKYITQSMDGLRYIEFLGTGLLVTAAMWTSSFECTFGTFIRLEFQKVYNGMLAAPLTTTDLVVGEIIWAGTKGFFFSFCVLCVLLLFGIVRLPYALLAPLVGFVTGVMFAVMSLFVTSFVKTINQFNFYMTGFISPMFFFSGVVFPISNLPRAVQPVAQVLPLTHAVKIIRAVCTNSCEPSLALNILYIMAFIAVVGYFAVKRISKRLVY